MIRHGDVGCSVWLAIVAAAIAVFLCGCTTTEWSNVHRGILTKAEVSGDYLNVVFQDGFSRPVYISHMEGTWGWNTGVEHILQHRTFEGSSRFRLFPVQAESGASAAK